MTSASLVPVYVVVVVDVAGALAFAMAQLLSGVY